MATDMRFERPDLSPPGETERCGRGSKSRSPTSTRNRTQRSRDIGSCSSSTNGRPAGASSSSARSDALPTRLSDEMPVNEIVSIPFQGAGIGILADRRTTAGLSVASPPVIHRTALADAQSRSGAHRHGLLLSLLAIVIIGTARQITRPARPRRRRRRIAIGDFDVAPAWTLTTNSDAWPSRLRAWPDTSPIASNCAAAPPGARTARFPSAPRHCRQSQCAAAARLTKPARAGRHCARPTSRHRRTAPSEFLSTCRHELRTPLHGVLGYAQIMRREPKTTHPARNLVAIERCGQHLLTLINDILDLTRIEAGKCASNARPPSCRSCATTCTIIAQRAAQKGLTLRREIAAEVPREIETLPSGCARSCLNLLSNAVKFTGRGSVALSRPGEPDGMHGGVRGPDSGVGIRKTN